jgi:hypothetical protein
MKTEQNDNSDIVTFYKNNKINNNFNEILYKVAYPETVDFYQPYCRDNSIDDKHRLYFHYSLYNKPIKKSNNFLGLIDFYLFNKLDESFDEVAYQKMYPQTKNFYQPECSNRNISDKYRLYYHSIVTPDDRTESEKALDKLAWSIEIPDDFDEIYYEKKTPNIKGYCQPWAHENNITERRRLFHHYFLYGEKKIKSKCKNFKTKKLIRNCKSILIKIPTLGRPESLFKSIDSFNSKKSGKFKLSFIISGNESDQTTNNEYVIKKIKSYENTEIFFGNHKNKVQAYNANLENKNFDILIAASDDMLAIEQNYDEIIIENMQRYFSDLDGVLWFDTGDNEITDTLSILGEAYYRRFDCIYNEIYSGYYCDDEFTRVAFKLGRIRKINKKIITHNIPDTAAMLCENTYLKSLSHATKDKAIYKIRKSVQFDIASTQMSTYSNLKDIFFEEKRNKNQNNWLSSFTKYDDPLSSLELYVLENGDKKVSNMGLTDFISFSKNYFRDFRWTIPTVIHQIWFGDVPKEINKMMESFSKDYVKAFPNWRYVLWDEEKLESLDMINKDLYDRETQLDCKSDIARLEILNKFGGVYLDSDFIWLEKHSINSVFNLCENGILLSYEKNGSSIGKGFLTEDSTRCANGFFGASIYNPIIAFLIGQLRTSYEKNRRNGAVSSTGPDFVQGVMSQLNHLDVKFLDSKYAFPIWWCSDENRNPEYKKFLETKKLPTNKISAAYPEAIMFHKGFTSLNQGSKLS